VLHEITSHAEQYARVDLSEKGFFYADGESQASGRYFYSYSKAKAFFVGRSQAL